MTLEQLYFISQIVAAAALIASLVFVGMQIRQSNQQSRLASTQAVDNSLMSSFDPIYIPENSCIWTTGHARPAQLTAHEAEIFEMLMIRAFQSFNMVASRHARRAYDEEMFQPVAWYFASLLVTAGGTQWRERNWKIMPAYARAVLDERIAALSQPEAVVAEPITRASSSDAPQGR